MLKHCKLKKYMYFAFEQKDNFDKIIFFYNFVNTHCVYKEDNFKHVEV